jgi:hypothetical protein
LKPSTTLFITAAALLLDDDMMMDDVNFSPDYECKIPNANSITNIHNLSNELVLPTK